MDDYPTYVNCIRKRLKRNECEFPPCDDATEDLDCETCDDCNCDYCGYNNCQPFCAQCCAETICNTPTCCYKTCHVQCKTSRCRKKCKESCRENIQEKPEEKPVLPEKILGNITTIITLNALINNTNVIDIPVVLDNNNTSSNNFTLDESSPLVTYNDTGLNNCCNIVWPQQCKPTLSWPFLHCFHHKTKKCGNFCSTDTIHAQPYYNCGGPSSASCGMSMMYIPQPRPQCAYYHLWPYVVCGLNRQISCEGCYEHYAAGGMPSVACSPFCYDEGYGVGPYYRLGPFFRRSYGVYFPDFGFEGPSGINPQYLGFPPQQFYSPYFPSNEHENCTNESGRDHIDFPSINVNETHESVEPFIPSYLQSYYPGLYPRVEYPEKEIKIEIVAVNRTVYENKPEPRADFDASNEILKGKETFKNQTANGKTDT